jgi:hypothetical protein
MFPLGLLKDGRINKLTSIEELTFGQLDLLLPKLQQIKNKEQRLDDVEKIYNNLRTDSLRLYFLLLTLPVIIPTSELFKNMLYLFENTTHVDLQIRRTDENAIFFTKTPLIMLAILKRNKMPASFYNHYVKVLWASVGPIDHDFYAFLMEYIPKTIAFPFLSITCPNQEKMWLRMFRAVSRTRQKIRN